MLANLTSSTKSELEIEPELEFVFGKPVIFHFVSWFAPNSESVPSPPLSVPSPPLSVPSPPLIVPVMFTSSVPVPIIPKSLKLSSPSPPLTLTTLPAVKLKMSLSPSPTIFCKLLPALTLNVSTPPSPSTVPVTVPARLNSSLSLPPLILATWLPFFTWKMSASSLPITFCKSLPASILKVSWPSLPSILPVTLPARLNSSLPLPPLIRLLTWPPLSTLNLSLKVKVLSLLSFLSSLLSPKTSAWILLPFWILKTSSPRSPSINPPVTVPAKSNWSSSLPPSILSLRITVLPLSKTNLSWPSLPETFFNSLPSLI